MVSLVSVAFYGRQINQTVIHTSPLALWREKVKQPVKEGEIKGGDCRGGGGGGGGGRNTSGFVPPPLPLRDSCHWLAGLHRCRNPAPLFTLKGGFNQQVERRNNDHAARDKEREREETKRERDKG